MNPSLEPLGNVLFSIVLNPDPLAGNVVNRCIYNFEMLECFESDSAMYW